MAGTVVHLLRHGEVDNPTKVLYGRLPGFVLSELGQAMAARAAEALAGRDIALVVASPLERALQTAEPVAAGHGREVEVDERLIEAGNVFEGQRVAVGDGVLRRPTAWRHLYNPLRPSWGEPYAEVAARMRAAIHAARDSVPGRDAVLVSHQLPIWIARLDAEHRRLAHSPTRRQCGLGSITSLCYQGEELVSVTYVEPSADLIAAAGPEAARAAGA